MPNRGHEIFFEFEADRVIVERREDIDDAAPDAEIAGFLGLGHALIAHRGQRLDHRFQIDALRQGDADDRILEHAPRQRSHHQGLSRRDDHRCAGAKHRKERGELRRLHIGRRRQMRQGTYFPGRQKMNPRGGRITSGRLIEEECEFAHQSFCLARKRRDCDYRTLQVDHRLAQHQRVGRPLEAHQRKAPLATGLQPRMEFAGLARGHDPGGDVVLQRENGDRRLSDREGRGCDHWRQQSLEALTRFG